MYVVIYTHEGLDIRNVYGPFTARDLAMRYCLDKSIKSMDDNPTYRLMAQHEDGVTIYRCGQAGDGGMILEKGQNADDYDPYEVSEIWEVEQIRSPE